VPVDLYIVTMGGSHFRTRLCLMEFAAVTSLVRDRC